MALSDEDIRRIWNWKNPDLEPDRDIYQILRDTSAGVRHLIAEDLDPTGLTDAQLQALTQILAAERARRSGGA